MLAVDASFVAWACEQGRWPALPEPLVAPPLLWPETRAALHQQAWRGELSTSHAERAHEQLLTSPVQRREPEALGREAWRIADELGWARTYDAEYVALARLLGCRLLTVDGRLRRGADRLGVVIVPEEL